MSARASLRAALVDSYHHSWRLVILNGALSVAVGAILVAASYVQLALLLVLLVGPFAAALMHCAVRLSETEELRVREALTGLRLHWRRGLALAVALAIVFGLGVFAAVFYARAGGAAIVLAVLTAYLLFLFFVLQLVLWPVAVKQRTLPLARVAAEAGRSLLRRPLPSLGLAVALLMVNALGVLTVLPFLTLTVAYSFVAAAHFALPPPAEVSRHG